jgi:hypothetical protein
MINLLIAMYKLRGYICCRGEKNYTSIYDTDKPDLAWL